MVSIMIYTLMGLQVTMVHNVVNLVTLYPKDVPVITFHLFVAALSECFKHTVSESSFKFDLRKVSSVVILFDVFSKVLRHI
jgi:hypothetical protein